MSNVSALWRLLAFLCCSTAAVGQVSGRFYLEKETFAIGEPVFLYFEASNSGKERQDLLRADPYSFCAGYDIHLSSDPASNSACTDLGIFGSCLSSSMILQPGARFAERILLNYAHHITAAGDYVVKAGRRLPYGPRLMETSSPPTLEVHETLRFRVEPDTSFPSDKLQIWVDRLHSPAVADREEAARTLASLAPYSLEDVLLGFAGKEEFRHWAPLAMHRLNTPRAMAAVAEMLRTSGPGTPESLDAARFLGSSGDPQWFLLLFALAKKQPGGGYLYPAAECGGDRAVPFLIDLMHSDTQLARQVAISAMAYTGSRAAIPVLLDLLKSPDPDVSARALHGLEYLTHRKLTGAAGSPQSQYPNWLEWWSRHGAGVRIYKAADCREPPFQN